MRLTRLYQPQTLICGQVIDLSMEAAQHLIRVLRGTIGDPLIVFNGQGGEFQAKIVALTKKKVQVKIEQYREVSRESPIAIELVQSLIRSEKMDYVIQKTVELGVTQIFPVLSTRSVLRLAAERQEKRQQHWQAIAVAACEQSGRTQVPNVTRVNTFERFIHLRTKHPGFILLPGASCSLAEQIKTLKKPIHSLRVLVGPEGGWSEEEQKVAQQIGYQPIHLGPRILRTETAGIVIIALLQGLLGDMAANLV
jgi:16S rRNA (uracil1498-N3)-methyltransferase